MSKPEDLDLEVIYEYLDDLANMMYCDSVIRPLGPVLEYDFIFDQDINYYNTVFKEGLHRLTVSHDHNPIAYQGPGEEG